MTNVELSPCNHFYYNYPFDKLENKERYLILMLQIIHLPQVNYPIIWPQFFTATIQNWKPLLKDDEYKNIITECLSFLVN